MKLQVQRHLQLRIEAQGKYMQTILEKACQTLAGGGGETNLPSGSFQTKPTIIGPDFLTMKEFGLNNFPSFQDVNMYASDHHQLHLTPAIDTPSSNLLGKKRPNPYSNDDIVSPGKGPTLWAEDLRLHQDLGTSVAHLNDDDENTIAPALSMDHRHHVNVDLVSDVIKYESKPILSGDQFPDKKLDVTSTKVERLNAAATAAGGMTRGYVVK